MDVDWSMFPPVEPHAPPSVIASMVSLSTDRDLIFRLGFPVSLLKDRAIWTSELLARLSMRGRTELSIWLSQYSTSPKESLTSPTAPRESLTSPRGKEMQPCAHCRVESAGYPQAPHSIFCSRRCRLLHRARPHRMPTSLALPSQPPQTQISGFGPVRQPFLGPVYPAAAQLPVPVPKPEAFPLDRDSSSDTIHSDNLQVPGACSFRADHARALENVAKRMTVQKLRLLQSMEKISLELPSGKTPLKTDRIEAIVNHFLGLTWEQFKAAISAIGVEIAQLDLTAPFN